MWLLSVCWPRTVSDLSKEAAYFSWDMMLGFSEQFIWESKKTKVSYSTFRIHTLHFPQHSINYLGQITQWGRDLNKYMSAMRQWS